MCILPKELAFSVDEIYTTFLPLGNQVHCGAMEELYIGHHASSRGHNEHFTLIAADHSEM